MKRRTLAALAVTVIGLSAATTARAAAPPPSLNVQGDCAGVTITVSGYPTGTSVTVGVDSEPPYGFTFGEPDPWGRFQPQSDGSVVGHLVPGNYAVAHPPFHVIAGVVGSTAYTDYVVQDCAVPVATTVPATTQPVVSAPPETTVPPQDFTVVWANVELAPPW